MTPTKDQQAQEYADAKVKENYGSESNFEWMHIKQAYLDGYAAAEQSMWRSVEDELPEEDGAYLALTTDNEIEIFVWEEDDWLVSGYTVAYWRKLPSLPDTNTEKKCVK